MRPISIGIDIVDDRAAIFAEVIVCRSYRNFRQGGNEAVAGEGEILFEFAALDVARHALDVIEAVEGFADAAQPDEPARFQDRAVARDVQAAGGGDRFGASAPLSLGR